MVEPNKQIPIIQLPLYAYLSKSQYWYGLIPELICLQGIWIEKCVAQVVVDDDLKPYLLNAASLHRTATMIAGNDRAYFSLYSMRAILERVALAWTAHPKSAISDSDVLQSLKSNDMSARKRATQDFIDIAESFDSDFKLLYKMASQYFAHASKMDSIAIDGVTEKDELLRMRMKVLPLLLLLDTGHRIVLLIQELLAVQGISFRRLDAGRKPEMSYDIEKYVRLCAYITCEKHTPKSGVPIRTLMQNVKHVPGKIGLNSIYRGGMEVVRFGDVKDRPEPKEIADFAWYGIGRDHDDKVKVKCVKATDDGEIYNLSWPKSIEIDSSAIGFIAAHKSNPAMPLFDYVEEFLKVAESQ